LPRIDSLAPLVPYAGHDRRFLFPLFEKTKHG
jgi:hypothetical protein